MSVISYVFDGPGPFFGKGDDILIGWVVRIFRGPAYLIQISLYILWSVFVSAFTSDLFASDDMYKHVRQGLLS